MNFTVLYDITTNALWKCIEYMPVGILAGSLSLTLNCRGCCRLSKGQD